MDEDCELGDYLIISLEDYTELLHILYSCQSLVTDPEVSSLLMKALEMVHTDMGNIEEMCVYCGGERAEMISPCTKEIMLGGCDDADWDK